MKWISAVIAVVGMLAVGVLVWRSLQRQEAGGDAPPTSNRTKSDRLSQ